MEDSHLPIRIWMMAFAILCSAKKSVSALQLQRQLGIGSYRSAWHMAHRIRHAMSQEPLAGLLKGTVEVDETYVGGKPRKGTGPHKRGRGTKKVPVVALVERGGRVRAFAQPREGALHTVRMSVDRTARVFTDEWVAYRNLHKTHPDHHTIQHKARVYVHGDVHTQTVEGFFGNIKTGIAGNYHGVSAKWLQGYVNEFVWRYNHRTGDVRSTFVELLGRAIVVTR